MSLRILIGPFLMLVFQVGHAQMLGTAEILSKKLDSVKTHLVKSPNQPITENIEDNLNIALLLLQLGDNSEVVAYLESAEKGILKIDRYKRSGVRIRLANYWYFLNDFDKAISVVDAGIEDALLESDSLSLGEFYSSRSLYYAFSQGNVETKESEDMLLLSLKYLTKNTKQRANTLYRLAETFYAKKALDSAALYHSQFDLVKDSLPATEAAALKIIEYTAKENFEAVDSMLIEQLKDYEEMKWNARIAFQYALLAQNAVALNDYNLSIDRGLEGYQIAVNNELTKERGDILTMLITAYELNSDYKNALFCTRELDSIQNSFRDVTQQLAQKDLQKIEAQAQAQKEKILNEKKSLELENKQRQQNILYGGIGVFVLLTFFAFRAYRQKRKDHILIEKQKKLVEAQRDEVELQKTIIEEAHREITDSINYAERIQRSFLATDDLLSSNLKDFFVFFQPKDVVSGDFYWARKLDNRQFAILNADSTGHGVPGAIMSILNVSSIEWSVEKGILEPAAIFNNARALIIERLKKDGSEQGGKDGMDASLISIDFEQNKLNFVAANNPIWIIRDKQLIEIKGEKMPVGKHDKDNEPFIGGSYELQTNDLIYTITDGFQDQFGGEKGKKFKIQPLKDLLIEHSHLPLGEQKIILANTFNSWKSNHEQIDDVCVIGVRI